MESSKNGGEGVCAEMEFWKNEIERGVISEWITMEEKNVQIRTNG